MMSYDQLRRHPASKKLFDDRITTLRDLQSVLQNSALIAIDTEHVAITSERDRVLHQVGLAYFQTLTQRHAISLSTRQLDLQDFYNRNHIQALTLNINIEKQSYDGIIHPTAERGMPTRRPHRFGKERQVDLGNLEVAMINFIKSCDNKANILLAGFEMAAEWTYLSRFFPRILPFFSAWVDLRDIAKDITSSIGVIPGLVSSLQIFGYHRKDMKPDKKNPHDGVADNAGDDAVATCALAEALLSSRNQEMLRF